MNKKEAIQAMLDVKCVYHVKWKQGEFCKINDVGRIIRYERGCFSPININSQPEDGWEIYEEPKKHTGSVIGRRVIVYNRYLFALPVQGTIIAISDSDGAYQINFDGNSHGNAADRCNGRFFFAEECRFIEKKEPKKKVKMWQWVVRVSNNIYLTERFFTSKTEVKLPNSHWEIIKHAGWTEIEVEDDDE